MIERFAVVYEAEADFIIATELADRELCDAIDWLDEDHLSHQRIWLVTNKESHPLTWKALKHLARQAGIRTHGHFDGDPGQPDAAAARRAIEYLLGEFPDLDAIVLIRDQDKEPARRDGLEQARRNHLATVAIVIGLAIVEREAWVICGFDPDQDREEEATRLDREIANLGFDPRLRSHDLTSCKDDNGTRSPKRVLKYLSGADNERERQCWTDTPLARLRERGQRNGLTDYLAEVRSMLAPRIGHVFNAE